MTGTHPPRRRAAVALRLALLVATTIAPLSAQRRPDPTALVGTRTWEWIDSTRTMPGAEGTTLPRRVMVQAWYPAADSGRAGRAPRLPEWRQLREVVSPQTLTHLAAPTASHLDAPARAATGAPIGVVLLSHGLWQRRTDYLLTAEALAARGFVVVGVDHPGGASVIAWQDGSRTAIDPAWDTMSPPNQTAERYQAFTEAQLVQWATDLQLVMTRWREIPGLGDLDPATLRWGALGHSNGGKAVALLCEREPAVRACANLDGWPVPASVEVRGLAQPYLHMEDLRDASEAEFEAWGSSLIEYTRNMDRLQDRRTAFLRAMRGPAYHLLLPGIRHASFTDWPALDPAYLPEGARRPPREALAEIATYLDAFFREYLLDTPQPLLHPTAEFTSYDRGRWLTPK
ncbi:MAG: hypothetical protein R3B35_12235 [Gemmatimonadales bacterium]